LNEVRVIDDRASAVILSALVEHHLEMAIRHRLIRTDETTVEKLVASGGALSGFLAKIWLGYAMGIFSDPELAILDKIRTIRNAFAHAPAKITFWTDQVNSTCMLLPPSTLRDDDPFARLLSGIPDSKERFISACFDLMIALIGSRRTPDPFPEKSE
jgi:hypothetical protein